METITALALPGAVPAETVPVEEDTLLARIVEGLNRHDQHAVQALKTFMKNRKEQLKTPVSPERIVCRISSPEVINAIIQFHRNWILVMAAERALKMAKQQLDLDRAQATLMLELCEDIPPDIIWEADVNRLLVLTPEKNIKFEAIRDMARRFVQMPDEQIAGFIENQMANALAEVLRTGGIDREFAVDLAKFIKEQGKTARDLIQRILHEKEFATLAAADKSLGIPIRFLAELLSKGIVK